MEFAVRDARADDAAPIAELSGELGYPTDARKVRGVLERVLARADQRIYVAESPGGSVCGWLQAHSCEVIESGLRVEIMGLVVSASARRGGVGRALVSRAEAWASQLSAGYVVVRSNVRREESHAFYPALGYAKTKTQAVYLKKAGA
jgi:GNAT superfamily N-acetyltransferase